MTDGQFLAGAAIVVIAIWYYAKFLKPMMNKGWREIDEIDISVARFKKRRADQGLCIYCGTSLESDWPPPDKGSPICAKCHSEMYPT